VIDSVSWTGRCACCDGRTDAAAPFVDRDAPVPPVRRCARRRGGRVREFLNGQQWHREQGVSDSGHAVPCDAESLDGQGGRRLGLPGWDQINLIEQVGQVQQPEK
jgi:hypothetical protein